jgi:hypothetical protein
MPVVLVVPAAMVCIQPLWSYFTVTDAPFTAEAPEVTLNTTLLLTGSLASMMIIPRLSLLDPSKRMIWS